MIALDELEEVRPQQRFGIRAFQWFWLNGPHGGYPHFTFLPDTGYVRSHVRRPVTALIAIGATLGVGATALAQGGDDRLSVDLQDGCLNRSRVAVVIDAARDGVISPLTVHANGRELLRPQRPDRRGADDRAPDVRSVGA